MDRIKLTNAGEAVTFVVAAIEENRSGKWPDYEFHATDGRVVVMPKNAADRQFSRMKETPASIIGSTVCISRSDEPGDNGKLFWNLTLAAPGAANRPASKRVSAADADPYVGVPALPDFPRSQGKPVQRVPVPQRSAPSHGGPLPGEEMPEDVEAWMGGPVPESPDGFEAFSAAVDAIAQPAPTPREVENAAYPNEKRTRLRNAYLALWRDVAMFTATEAKAHGFTVDGASVNATTFSIWGTWKESGLRPS